MERAKTGRGVPRPTGGAVGQGPTRAAALYGSNGRGTSGSAVHEVAPRTVENTRADHDARRRVDGHAALSGPVVDAKPRSDTEFVGEEQ